MDFALAIALGLLGSLHCAAMCGPLQLALPLTGNGPGRIIVGRVVYQLGRIATYCVLGVIAGLAGKSIVLAGMQRWISIGLGIAILGGFFGSRKLVLAAPVVRAVMRLKAAMATQLRRRNLASLGLLGALNGLLPCGLVYVAMTGAVSRGAVASSVFFMAAFGLGTVPTMLAVSLSGRILPTRFRLRLQAAIPLGVCALATLLILRGMSLGIPYVSPDLSAAHPSCCQVP